MTSRSARARAISAIIGATMAVTSIPAGAPARREVGTFDRISPRWQRR